MLRGEMEGQGLERDAGTVEGFNLKQSIEASPYHIVSSASVFSVRISRKTMQCIGLAQVCWVEQPGCLLVIVQR